MKLDEWIRESGDIDLSPLEKALRQDLVDGILYLRTLFLCPGDLLTLSNIGIKDGRAVFFDIMNQRTPLLTEEEVLAFWAPKEKGFWS